MSGNSLALSFLGAIQVEMDGAAVRGIESSKGRALLAYLAVESDRPHSRESLAAMFWPDHGQEAAMRNLRQVIYNLRQALASAAAKGGTLEAGSQAAGRETGERKGKQPEYLEATRQDVRFNRDCPHTLDVAIFRDLLSATQRHPHPRLDSCHECILLLQEAVNLYRGEFLAGFTLPDEDAEVFEFWLRVQRDQLAHEAVTALETLATFHERRQEFGQTIAYLRRQLEIAPWREEGHRHLMRVLAGCGDRSAALQQYETCRKVLWEQMAAPLQAETEALHQQILFGAFSFQGEIASNPYKGLQSFAERDSSDYVGREEALVRLMHLVTSRSVVVLNGSSGSGKSSLIRAGLLPTLRAAVTRSAPEVTEPGQRRQDTITWHVIDLRLGSQPLENLAAALSTKLEPPIPPGVMAADLRTGKRTLPEVTQAILSRNGASEAADASTGSAEKQKMLLIIDQFEELFTLSERQRIDEMLGILLPEPAAEAPGDSAHTLLLSLRGGFGRFMLSRRALVDAMQEGLLLLGPMNRSDLERTIVEPARNRGILLEEGLTERILTDVGGEPGRLPLLQFALTQLWERRFQGKLTHAAYDAIGGVSGALARYADEVFSSLTPDEQVRAKELLTQLVRPGEATDDTSLRVTRAALSDDYWPLVLKLADARLLVIDQDALGQDTVELAHEALIRYWGRLRAWLEDDRVFRLWRLRLETAYGEWERDGRSDDMLLRGGNLSEGAQWVEQRPGDLPQHLLDFVAASQQAYDSRRTAEEARKLEALAQAQTLAAAKAREGRRLRLSVTILAGALVLAVAAIIIAWSQRGEAQRQANRAQAAEATAEARRDLAESALLAEKSARTDAEAQQRIAQDALLRADANQQQAEAAQRESQVQARLALGRELSANVANLQNGQPDLALLLALESDKLLDDVADRNRLLTSFSFYYPLLAKVLHGASVAVLDASFSADNPDVIVGLAEAGIWRWNEATGQALGQSVAFPQRTLVSALAPGGQRAVTAEGEDLVLWHAETGEVLARLKGHTSPVQHVAFSTDGSRLGSTDQEGTLILWDGASGRQLRRLPGFGSGGLALGPGGRFLAIYGHLADPTGIEIWNLDRDARVAGPVYGHEATIESIGFSPDGSRLVTASDDRTVRLWDGRTGEPIGEPLSGHTSPVAVAKFSPDGRVVASGGADNQVLLWDLASGKTLGAPLRGHPNWVRSLAFDAAGRSLISGDAGGQVNLWDLSRRKELQGHKGRVRELALTADGQTLFTSSYDKTVRVWDPETGDLRSTLATEHSHPIMVLKVSPDGRTFTTGDASGHFMIWDAATLQPLHPLAQAGSGEILAAAYSPDGRLLVLAGADGGLTVWDVASGRRLAAQAKAHDGYVFCLAFSPDGALLASGGGDDVIKWWDVSKLGEGGEAALVEVGQPSTGHTGWVTSLAFAPDGKTLISGGADPAIRFWNVITHEASRAPWREHLQTVWDIELGAWKGQPVLISLGYDGTVLWQDLGTGAVLGPALAAAGETVTLAVDPQGTAFYLGSAGNTAQAWHLPPTDWQDWACQLANRNLTPEEWRQYLHNENYRKTCPSLP